MRLFIPLLAVCCFSLCGVGCKSACSSCTGCPDGTCTPAAKCCGKCGGESHTHDKKACCGKCAADKAAE